MSDDHPASAQSRVVIDDDLRRSRLTVFFRFLLALPHLILLALWSILAALLAVVDWFVVLLTGRPVARGLQTRYVRYFTHVLCYLALTANPFPGFTGESRRYPIDLEVDEPDRQSRWKTVFRIVLAVPAILLGFVLVMAGGQVQTGGDEGQSSASLTLGVIGVAAILGWFASLVRGRMPQGLRDLAAYAIGYLAQLGAYLLLVTDRYPTSDPLYPRYRDPAPRHPVRIVVDDDLRRSRLTVFFRFLLWLPHMVWLLLWGLAAALVFFANWFVTLFAGRPAPALHRFLSRYVRYWTHTSAFVYLVANPFPGFGGQPGTYPIDLELPDPARQNRWKTGFRLILCVPSLIVAGALANALSLVAVFGWFTGLILGRMPTGLRNLGALALRYQAQAAAYVALLTDRYPYAGPSLEVVTEAEATPAAAPAPQPG
jgi:hypothetical protein